MERHRPLTLPRLIRGILCIITLILTAFVLLIFFGFWTAVVLRFFSLHLSRKLTAFFFGRWIALWPFLFEKINKTKVIFSGEQVGPQERVLLIANHRTEVDWMYLWDLALRKKSEGCIKYILKNSLMKLPVFGWVFHIMEFIPVARKWEEDELKMRSLLKSFGDFRDPLWLAIFPEGTDFTEEKCLRSKKYASKNGLPLLNNVLLPKTKGFYACLETLRGSLDAVYDVTIGYKHRCPSFLDNAFGIDPSEVHIHIRRISLNNIPTSEDQVSTWLINTFETKDRLLSEFYSGGHFPSEGTEADLSMAECVLNFLFVMTITCACTYLTLFSSIFRIYVSLACSYMVTATYFDIRPSPIPIFGP
ncbi:probable 1-acyl-sn-glycerol-3-phosphate acyltransferase 5 [Andrographis paniculata]|uniref:probable 1-acyl-sn-glycerol-3-phosphate acyltransferase 5 n=1 Tax=Andrographis paniculata TaxID=175694 RepID=UPI0021E737C2|nr:probable 1-acyl-sn-glycerol-3-phosphate acyltransferase 5 [Andrographis paniculata]